jgi:hypothetical protein
MVGIFTKSACGGRSWKIPTAGEPVISKMAASGERLATARTT